MLYFLCRKKLYHEGAYNTPQNIGFKRLSEILKLFILNLLKCYFMPNLIRINLKVLTCHKYDLFVPHVFSHIMSLIFGGKYCFSHLNPPLKPPQRSKTDDSTMFNRYSWQDIISWLDPIICVLCSDSTKVAVKWSANLKQFSRGGGGIKHVELLKFHPYNHMYVVINFEICRWCLQNFVDIELLKCIHHQIIYRYTWIYTGVFWKKTDGKITIYLLTMVIETTNCHENNR